jgi:dolichol-phosphate mannosyltransferase
MTRMSSSRPGVSVIVPTFREAPNIEPLVRRVFAALGNGPDAELVIVDDNSQDGTERIVERLRGEYAVRLVVRRGERGLAGAVVAGLKEARHDRLVVLDADLQHPPELIPQMVERLEDSCDFVMATRYSGTGSVAEDWPWHRRLASRFATLLARPVARLSDPMSGFFALRRETWERAAPFVDAIGYKIGLELFVKGRCRNPREVPIAFAARHAGVSKLGMSAQWAYVRHLTRLYRFRFPKAPWLVVGLVVLMAALFILLFVWES